MRNNPVFSKLIGPVDIYATISQTATSQAKAELRRNERQALLSRFFTPISKEEAQDPSKGEEAVLSGPLAAWEAQKHPTPSETAPDCTPSCPASCSSPQSCCSSSVPAQEDTANMEQLPAFQEAHTALGEEVSTFHCSSVYASDTIDLSQTAPDEEPATEEAPNRMPVCGPLSPRDGFGPMKELLERERSASNSNPTSTSAELQPSDDPQKEWKDAINALARVGRPSIAK